MLDIRPASLLPYVFLISIAIEYLVFRKDLLVNNKIKSFLKLVVGKFISICFPYLTLLMFNRNDTTATRMEKEAAAQYIKEADEYLYEAFNLSPYFIGFFIIVELPLFYLWFCTKENRKRLLPKFIVINILLAVIFALFDFLICRHPQIT